MDTTCQHISVSQEGTDQRQNQSSHQVQDLNQLLKLAKPPPFSGTVREFCNRVSFNEWIYMYLPTCKLVQFAYISVNKVR